MSNKNRNFRSTYYDKVGFRGVEERKSLEKLLNEKPMDKGKLSKFCNRFTLPSMYREYVWQVLLDVLPVNPETHEIVMNHRMESFIEAKRALTVMQKINENTPKPLVFTLMFLVTQELLAFNLENQMKENHVQNLIVFASAFLNLGSSDVISYWLFRNFAHFQKKFSSSINILKEQFEVILRKEDDELFKHLENICALEVLPLDLWFNRYFVDIIHYSSLPRILDKIIGGHCKILPFIGAAILIILRHSILSLNVPDKILNFLVKIPEDNSDVVINKALDLYYA